MSLSLTLYHRIIVGVKYCFRYNQRNRRAQQDENGEPIDMTNMPHGPRRRRREKKLMSMDEVNERFPLMKYKAWMTTRAEEGLPTAGGVAVPSASRAASLRNAEGVAARSSVDAPRPTTPADAKDSMDEPNDTPEAAKTPQIPTSPTANAVSGAGEARAPEMKSEVVQHEEVTSTIAPTQTNDSYVHPDDQDEDDQIQMSVPTEMLEHPGDSCAICIDTLEDDDDVRGLTCGHAFHASCLDPWLTSRRACCPLCKADYYVPKPRPEGEAAAEAERHAGRRGNRGDMPHPPQYAFMGHGHRRPRMFFPGRSANAGPEENPRARHGLPGGRRNRGQTAQMSNDPPAPAANAASLPNPDIQQPVSNNWRSRITPSRPNIRMPNPFRSRQTQAAGDLSGDGAPEISGNNATPTTPGQLESGQGSRS